MSQSNADKIAQAQSNLELPEDPPTASDFSSADSRTVNVGSGDSKRADNPEHTSSSIREPATGVSEVRVSGEEYKQNEAGLQNVGRQGVEGLDGPPSDAVTRDKRGAPGLSKTEGKD